jgi:hypothetical protein
MFQPGLYFTAEFNKSKYSLRIVTEKKSNVRYAFVTENGLTLCEPNFMIGLDRGHTPPGQLKVIHLCIKP